MQKIPFKLWLSSPKISWLDLFDWGKVSRKLDQKTPTQGVMMLDYILQNSPQKLHIIGFSFFQTDWVSGHSSVRLSDYSMPEAHSPSSEARYVSRLVCESKGTVTVGHLSAKFLFI